MRALLALVVALALAGCQCLRSSTDALEDRYEQAVRERDMLEARVAELRAEVERQLDAMIEALIDLPAEEEE